MIQSIMQSTLEKQSTLAEILQPYSRERFLSENWTKRGIVIPSKQSDKFQHLFSWEILNDLLNYHKLGTDLRFALDKEVLPACNPQDWIKRCQEGATLVLDRAQIRVPAIADFTWKLQQELGHPCMHANIYCSWPSQQGFNTHFDTHEVFILQIDGTKEWFVFEDTFKYPYRGESHKSHTPPNADHYIHCILKPGDLLYIPRGHWHYAIAQEQPSLHVTFGIRGYTGRDAIDWIFENFVQTKLQEEEALRQIFPLMPHDQTDEFEAHFRQLFDYLLSSLEREKEKIVQQFITSLLMTSRKNPEMSLPRQVGFQLFGQGLNTIFRPRKFQPIQIKPLDEKTYALITPHKSMKFQGLAPNAIDTLVNKLLNQEAFTILEVVQQLPDCDLETQILPLLAGLIKEGIIVEDCGKDSLKDSRE